MADVAVAMVWRESVIWSVTKKEIISKRFMTKTRIFWTNHFIVTFNNLLKLIIKSF